MHKPPWVNLFSTVNVTFCFHCQCHLCGFAGRRAFQAKCSARSVTTHSQAESTVFNDRLITVIDTPGIPDLDTKFLLLTGLDVASDRVVKVLGMAVKQSNS